ncbi:hypothetical protein SDC9_159625 [bioreactor metagenome]|uniref:Uncharacterized protein n=1 Tax=bioreactor metagenome TaxID=1076179 RepID=A0A645FG31_9ZZZZ
MIHAVNAVADPYELDLFKLRYHRNDIHIVPSDPRRPDMVADAGMEPAADYQGYELNEQLGPEGAFGLHPFSPAAGKGLVGREQLFGLVPGLVQQQGVAGGHPVGRYDAEIAEKIRHRLNRLLFLPVQDEESLLPVHPELKVVEGLEPVHVHGGAILFDEPVESA